jgi:hypothetical protein
MIPKIVLISGKKGRGKDTLAKYLKKHLGDILGEDHISIRPYAASLKKAAEIIFMLSRYQIDDPKAKETIDPRWSMTPREIMQKIGTEVGRNIHPDVWVINTMAWAEHYFHIQHQRQAAVIIPDCRFPNEIEIPKKMWGEDLCKTIRIMRMNMPPTDWDDHISETALDDRPHEKWDEVIYNNLGLDALDKAAQSIVEGWNEIN